MSNTDGHEHALTYIVLSGVVVSTDMQHAQAKEGEAKPECGRHDGRGPGEGRSGGHNASSRTL